MKKILMTFTAALCCGMTMMTMLTSCSNIDDSPFPSTVDEGKWNLPDAEMDTSVRPGDDFFMYCNGGFWNTAEVDETAIDINSVFYKAYPALIAERMAALPFPTLEKLKADAAAVDSLEIIARLSGVLERINAITTREEAWKVCAQLMKEGYSTYLNVYFFSREGRIRATLIEQQSEYASMQPGLDKKSIQWQLLNNPDLLNCLHPLGRSASTRAYDHDKWPMLTTIFTELGIDLDDAYSVDESGIYAQELGNQIAKDMETLQSQDVDAWKRYLSERAFADVVLLDNSRRTEIADIFANQYLRYEKSYIFTNAYITPEMKQRTMESCIQLSETFRQRIVANEWMSEASKQSVIEKLDAMAFNIGCPDEWIMEGIPDISAEKTFFDDILALRRAYMALCQRLIGMDTASASWHVIITLADLTTMNAFYLPSFNAMNIFPAWMMDPIYDAQSNEAHNYATMMVFGHEITHGFDTHGARFNKFGDLGDMWATDADRQEFERRAQQLIDCYNGFEVMPWALPGLYADGAYTVAENIADLGGMLMAYDTYVRYLKENGFKGWQFILQRKRFFMGIAKLWQSKYSALFAQRRTSGDGEDLSQKDNHSLFRERVNGMVMNADAWYDLFPVNPGDKLYRAPEDRVRIW